jgi:predicted nucleic acid-binding protein
MPSAKRSCFVDTNILVYAVDPEEPEKRPLAADLLRRMIRSHTLVLSVQSLNECYRVITNRRRLMARDQARRFVAALSPCCTAPAGYAVTRQAWRIQDSTGFAWWDCLLLGSASLAGCRVFFSEDLRHGLTLDDLTIMNPFRLDTESEFPS